MRLKIFFVIAIALIFISPINGMASDKPSLAILPLRLNAPADMDYLKGAYRDRLTARILVAGGIQVEDPSKVQAAVDKHSTSEWSEDTKKSLSKEIGATFILEGSLSVIGDDMSLDVRLIEADAWKVYPMSYTGKGVGAFTGILEKAAADARGVILGNTPEMMMKDKEPKIREMDWKGQKLPLALKGIGVADLDNDGIKEIVVVDDKNVYIYAFDKDGLKLKKEIKGSGPSLNYNIAIGDFNGNGLPEVYLSRKYMEKAATRVIEFTGKDFVVIADDILWFVRTVKGPNRLLLVGEKFREIDGLYGGVKSLKWSNGTLGEEDPLDMPKWIHLYGFTFCDATGDGKNDFIYLDENDRLRLYEKEEGGAWKQIWRSSEYYGGSINNIEFGPTPAEQKTVNVKADIVCGQVVENGKREIVINSNDAVSRIFKNVSFKSGDVRGLLWNDVGLDDIWRTKKLSGYVADYVMADLNSDGSDEIVAIMVLTQPSLFKRGESLITTQSPAINLRLK